MWGQHPIRIMEQWPGYTDSDHRMGVASKQIRIFSNFTDVSKFLLANSNSIEPIRANEYSVSKDNVHIWCRCLLRCLELLESNLRRYDGVGCTSARETLYHR